MNFFNVKIRTLSSIDIATSNNLALNFLDFN